MFKDLVEFDVTEQFKDNSSVDSFHPIVALYITELDENDLYDNENDGSMENSIAFPILLFANKEEGQ